MAEKKSNEEIKLQKRGIVRLKWILVILLICFLAVWLFSAVENENGNAVVIDKSETREQATALTSSDREVPVVASESLTDKTLGLLKSAKDASDSARVVVQERTKQALEEAKAADPSALMKNPLQPNEALTKESKAATDEEAGLTDNNVADSVKEGKSDDLSTKVDANKATAS